MIVTQECGIENTVDRQEIYYTSEYKCMINNMKMIFLNTASRTMNPARQEQ